ncbi:hypothetical protein HDR59_03730, partial [bacterium]|nr:hypothetical protein [bacterium]
MNKLIAVSALTLLPTTTRAESVYMCEPCPAGYSCNNGVKTPCPAGTYSGAVSTSCTNCSAGQYQDASGQSSCKTCPEGKFSNSNKSACVNKCTVSAVNYKNSYIYSSGCGCVNQGSGGAPSSLMSSCRCEVRSETKIITAGQKAGTTITVGTWIYSGSMSTSKSNSSSGSNYCVSCQSKGNYKSCSSVKLVYDYSTNKIKFQCADGTVLAMVDAKDC